MAGTDDTLRLRVWSLSTFHTVSFVLAVVVIAYSRDSLSTTLAPFGTVGGLTAFALLWSSIWLATRWGLRRMNALVQEARTETLILSALLAGAWNGLGVFLAVLVAALAVQAFRGRGGFLQGLPGILFIAFVGSLIALLVGAVVGLIFGWIDTLLLGISATLYRRARVPDEADDARPGAGLSLR